VICLAAGLGKRTKVSLPKVLLPLCGRTPGGLGAACGAAAAARAHGGGAAPPEGQGAEGAAGSRRRLVRRTSLAELEFVDQGAPKGTGHAVQVAMQALQGFVGDVLVIYGDCPLITPETLQELCELRGDAPCSVLTAHPEDPTGLGRILRDDDGRFVGIREHRDCSAGRTADRRDQRRLLLLRQRGAAAGAGRA
jgi:bifunctional UDP-N-acetylglucosamine pyrophosphorylase/glucosamine-1-phosphate N-acetyltransferase